jgi:murein DD-endopeptidase MepM/ murein hydrolase activator NlpD
MFARKLKIANTTGLILSLVLLTTMTVNAASDDEIGVLQDEIQNRKAQIESINSRLDQYRKKIAEYASRGESLENELAILENDTALTELDIAATQNAIEEENLHLTILETGINDTNSKLDKEKDLLSDTLFEINKLDKQGGAFQMIVGARNFHDVFTAAAELESINSNLKKTLVATKQAKGALEEKKAERENRLGSLSDLQASLELKVAQLDAKAHAKEVLINETEQSESEYRELTRELRQEQESIAQRIDQLQSDIENKLAQSDTGEGPTVITWPVNGQITALFHDPSYPFRHLFEHGGLDIAVPQGTAVEAAAPGYVAWAQTGRQYGNYIMIIHADGLATLYAHLSRIDVSVDQFVTRGQIIGLSGGRPGTPGAGLSTGSHLHFEVRQNGIPTDPLSYLP